ncbi:hypothetical protein T439DRAFT_384164 [Meredithblackwellia eburnea MCA 4105]
MKTFAQSLGLAALATLVRSTSQIVLESGQAGPEQQHQSSKPAEAEFDPSSLLLTSLHAHLKSWYSPFAPNGFAVVPATIPTGTIMYHVRGAGPAPSSGLDWFALDAEHSYLFGRSNGSIMWHFASTRPLRVLYFDGASAAKTAGPIDVQEVVAYNRTLNGTGKGGGWSDFVRYGDLCEWAKQYDIDGFVREESTFEYVQCDFSSPAIKMVRGTQIGVTTFNTTGDGGRGPPGPPLRGLYKINELLGDEDDEPPSGPPPGGPPGGPGMPGPPGGGDRRKGPGGPGRGDGNIYRSQTGWLYQRATSRHHYLPDIRVRTHPEYLVSLYDTSYTSLRPTFPLPRGDHALLNLSDVDSLAFRKELHDVLLAWNSNSPVSGVDWHGVTAAAIDRYSDHLDELRLLFALSDSRDNITSVVDEARLISFGALQPYVSGPEVLSTYPSPPTPHQRFKALSSTADICTNGFTGHLDSELMTPQELRIKNALESVLRRVCDLTAGILGESLFLIDSQPAKLKDEEALKEKIHGWEAKLKDLMQWLGWPKWVACERKCEADEICYLPAPLTNPKPTFDPQCIKRDRFGAGPGGW